MALERFDGILESGNRRSPRALYGRAEALSALAERHRSNAYLERAIHSYKAVVEMGMPR